MPESLAEFFLANYHAHSRDRAFRQPRGYRTESFTYSDVLRLAQSLAADFHSRGLVKGDRLLLWAENSAEWAAAFLACTLRGIIVVPMDDAASPDFALRVFRQVGAKLLLASPRHIRDCADQSLPTLPLDDLPRNANPTPLPEIPLTRDDVLQIVFTSGTTADPKGVVITHGNVLANIAPLEREIRPYLKYERFFHPLRFLNLLPLSHVFGQFLGLYLPPLLGATVIFQDELKPSEIIRTTRRERASALVSVPRVLESLHQKIERDLEDRGRLAAFRQKFSTSASQHFLRRWWTFRSIRRQFGWKFWAFISGGAALDRGTEEFWGRLGYAAIQGYGLTETTSLISVNHPFRLGKGSIGKVLPGREIKLADDGEILVRGGGVASSYWRGSADSAAPKVSDDEGWYRTGDLGALDADGHLYFKGRKKEVIVTPAGMNIYPEDLEAALRCQPEVKDCVVVGIDRGGNAEPCAVLLLRESSAPSASVESEPAQSESAEPNLVRSIRDRANQSLAEYQRMTIALVWPHEDFPRTSTQKPRRNLIRDAALAQLRATRPSDSASIAPHENAVRDNDPLADLIARVSRRSVTIRPDANLDSDLGLSSLDRVELLSAVEDRYQVDLSEARFSAVRTIGDLERLIRGDAAPTAPYHYPSWTLRAPARWLRLAAQYLLMRPAILLLGWPRIEGREHLRGVRGPLLVISNHIGDVDPGFILTALPARFRHRLAIATGGEALEALRTPPASRNLFLKLYDRVQWLLGVTLLNLFPLPREAGFRRSFVYAGEAADRGYNVLVFPEGRHTTDGKLLPFRSGIGLLASNLGIPVLPMRIDGLFEFKNAGRHFAPPWRIRVKIGKPVHFDPAAKPEHIAAELQRAVAEL
jgi:long-chain acyl-CoA synthetase